MTRLKDEATAAILASDDARYDALLAGDPVLLARMLDDGFVHIHGTGRAEQKASFVESIRSGRVVYHRVEVGDRSTWTQDGIGVVRGHVVLDLVIADEPRRLDLAFLAVWRRIEDRWVLREWASVPVRLP